MWMRIFFDWIRCFFSLIFPDLCRACGNHLYEGETFLCTDCRMTLPYTHDQFLKETEVERILYGRVRIHAASAYLSFSKKSLVQRILHSIKYKGQEEFGEFMGRMHAHQLSYSDKFNIVDLCIPVPLHPEKIKKRGYNQSECIARGIVEVLKIPLEKNALQRSKHTETQTRKSRFSRFENMREVFFVSNKTSIENKHVLLVDDVITTGSTIESCVMVLLENGASSVSVACIAFAKV